MNNKNDSHSTPYWATESFKEFIDYVENLEHILRISTKGISMIRGVPKIVEVLAKAIEDEPPTTYEKRIEIANKEAELAQREVENGFPLLYSQAIVSLWGSLENLIHIFLEKWLMNEPEALLVNQVQKLRVQLGEYESLDSEERPCYILDLLERDIQAPLKQGITRFESLLEIFKLGGSVDEVVRKNLFELNHIRNVIVHRKGIADKKLIQACPWLEFKVGDKIFISHQDYRRYSHAVIRYAIELIVRVAVYFGKSRDDFKDQLENKEAG